CFGPAPGSRRGRRQTRCRPQPTHKIRLASRSAIAVPPAAPRIFFDVTSHSVASGPRARLPGHSGPSDSFTLLYVRRACATPHPERPCAKRDDQARAILARSTRSGSAIGTTDKSNPNYWNFPDNVVTYGGSSDLWGETWTAADINDPNFGFALAVFVGDSVALVDAMSITVFYNTLCGNNQIDPNEDCDDGNTLNGDCCSSTCKFDPPGTPCPDATLCNGDETCNGAGVCNPGTALDCDDHNLCTQDSCNPISGCVNDGSPHGGCRTALKSILLLKDKSPDSKDKLVWKWVKGQSTTQSEFGVPSGTTQYALCIHAGTSAALLASYNVPADAMKWSALGTKGYKYTDPAGSAAGITKGLLKGSTHDKAKCLMKGKGTNLADFDLTMLVDPVTVQLVNSANTTCFESTFDQADFIKFD